MEIRQLRYFVAVAETEHFGRGAERVQIAQPAVSRQIKLLEAELRVELFERLPRGVRLTTAGLLFMEEARRILRDIDRLSESARGASRGITGVVNLALVESAAWHGVAPTQLRRFREARPEVEVELAPMTSSAGHDAVRNGRVDAALAYYCPKGALYDRHIMAVNDVMLALPKQHPLSRLSLITLKHLHGEALVTYQRSSTPLYYDAVLNAFANAGVAPRIVQLAINEAALLFYVSAGVGVAIVTSMIRWRRPANIALRPVRGLSIPLTLELLWRRDNKSPVLADFVGFMRGYAASR